MNHCPKIVSIVELDPQVLLIIRTYIVKNTMMSGEPLGLGPLVSFFLTITCSSLPQINFETVVFGFLP